ncbi:MAG: class A beta-lactamase-related serine hydrolase, partial [Castellaniella sp.]
MQFQNIFLLIAGALGLACTPLPAAASLAPPASAALSTSVDNAPQKLPAARVKQTLADYQHWLDRLAQRDAVAGLATAVVIDDKVVFEGTVGYADAATKQPIKPDTVFRLASLSKAFATAIAGLLVDDGKLDWDTKLVDVLPYFKLKDMQAASQATVGDILGQRLGLPRNTYD